MFNRGGNTLGIGLAVYLRDEFSAKAQRIRSSMADLSRDQDKLLRKNLNSLDQLGSGMLLASGGYLYFLSRAVKEAAIFENHMATVRAVTDDNTASMAALEKQIRRVGTTGVFSIDEIAKAGVELGKAGYKRKEIIETLQAASDLGAVGGISPELAADALGRVLNMYDLKTTQSQRIANQIAIAANKSAVSVSELLESLKYSGDVARNLNIPFEETLAVFMRLGNAGLRGSMAGTSYANMLRYVAKASTEFSTGRQKQAIDMLGMTKEDFVNSKGNLRSVTELMSRFSQHLQGIDPVKATAIMEAITGVRGGRAMEPLLKVMENKGSLQDFINIIKDTPDYLKKAADVRMDNLWGDIERLKDGWKNFMIEFARQPGIRMAVQFATKLVGLLTSISQSKVGKVFMSITTLGMIGVGVLGLMSKGAAFMGRAVLNTGVNFASMGKSAVWSWNAARAAALRYFTAVNVMYKGGTFRASGMGAPIYGANGNPIPQGGFVPGGNAAARNIKQKGFWGTLFSDGMNFSRGPGANFARMRTLSQFGRPMAGFLNMIGKATGALFTFIGPIMSLIELIQGNTGAGIGGLLGGVAGFFAGGPMGAAMGSMVGTGIGSMFDEVNNADDLVRQAVPRTKNRTTFSELSKTQAERRQTIIINVDGKKAIQKDIDNYNDEIFNAQDY